jgi:hypothetical protein
MHYRGLVKPLPRDAANPSGTITALDSDGLHIALDRATLLVRRVRLEPSPKKVAPSEAGDLLRRDQRL